MTNNKSQKNWPSYITTISKAGDSISALFSGVTPPYTAWEWLSFLEKEIKEFKMGEQEIDLDLSFYYTLIGLLDFKAIQIMSATAAELNAIIPTISVPVLSKLNFPADWLQLCREMDFSFELTNSFLQRVNSLPKEQLNEAINTLRLLHSSYLEFKKMMELVAAALLYYLPKGTPLDIIRWKKLISESASVPEKAAKIWAPMMRFMGQAVFSRDAEMRDEAIFFLETFQITEETFDNNFETLLIIIMIYLVFNDFKNIPREKLVVLFGRYVWLILTFNIPIDELLKDALADEDSLIEYITQSGGLAGSMYNSKEVIFYGENDSKTITLEQFFHKFTAFARGDELNGYTQIKYVDEVIQVYGLFPENRQNLLGLLSLYLHLRECDLIDYRGLLSDDGVKRSDAPDWKQVIHEDITEDDLEKFKRHFTLLHRPLRVRMEIIIALDTVTWREEPYFSRALLLSNLYEEMYGHIYGPIVYFSQENGLWEIYRWINDPWGLFLPITVPPDEPKNSTK